VVTTGATFSACAEALADAGARRISGLAFARDL
jgi:predicted amidophosphoribosyltransferase